MLSAPCSTKLYYFGTSSNRAGFFLFEVSGGVLQVSRFRLDILPFKIEMLPYSHYGPPQPGIAHFYLFCGYSILAISGSAVDKKMGATTVFFVNEGMTEQRFDEMLQSVPAIREVLAKIEQRFPIKRLHK